ncbi:MAG: hypothetical protein KKH93_03910, partial [Candidatus Omnitrophica bacterium]|nr:hypothetical protein [Candidatus Omnitrophota bacterium]
NRVDEFLSGYKLGQKELNSDTQKLVAGLLFKNIKIAKKDIFSWELFPPFNSFFLESEKSKICRKNQRISQKPCLKSILERSAAR